MNGDLHSLSNPSAAAVRHSAGGRKRGRGKGGLRASGGGRGGDPASPTSASSSAGDWGGPAAKRARLAVKPDRALAAAIRMLARTPGLAMPEPRVPRDNEDGDDATPGGRESDVLPAELAVAAAAATQASWCDWFLEDAQWQKLAALLDAPHARRYSGPALAFFLQHARHRPPSCTAFLEHAQTVRTFEANAPAAMTEAGAERPHRVLTDAQLDAIVHALVPDAGPHTPVWRAFLRWMRPHGGAELRWRANAAQRMLGDPVRRATLTDPPDVPSLRDPEVRVRHYNRAIVPLVNGLRQQLRTDELEWRRLRQHVASPVVQELGAAETAFLDALLAAQKDMTLCTRRSRVKKNPVALATQTAPAVLLLPPALPPGTTFSAATQQLLRPDGSDPWAAHYAAARAPPPLTAPAAETPPTPHPATVDWVAATCTAAPADHPGTRFAALWRLYAHAVPDADAPTLLAALRHAGFVSAQYAPPAPLSLCFVPPATLADAQTRLALLTDDAGPTREAALVAPPPVTASPTTATPTTATRAESAHALPSDDFLHELSRDMQSVDFSD